MKLPVILNIKMANIIIRDYSSEADDGDERYIEVFSLMEAIKTIGGDEALVAWDRDIVPQITDDSRLNHFHAGGKWKSNRGCLTSNYFAGRLVFSIKEWRIERWDHFVNLDSAASHILKL